MEIWKDVSKIAGPNPQDIDPSWKNVQDEEKGDNNDNSRFKSLCDWEMMVLFTEEKKSDRGGQWWGLEEVEEHNDFWISCHRHRYFLHQQLFHYYPAIVYISNIAAPHSEHFEWREAQCHI